MTFSSDRLVVTLTFPASTVVAGDADAVVAYADADAAAEAGDVVDQAGTPLADETETVDSDVLPTQLVSASAAPPNEITITVNEPVRAHPSGTALDASQFSYDPDGSGPLPAQTPSSASASGTEITLGFGSLVGPGGVLTYTDGDAVADPGDVVDTLGNALNTRSISVP